MIELKVWKEFFQPIWEGKKNFELRREDRDFQQGSLLLLREYDPVHDAFSGREVIAMITYKLSGKDCPARFGLQPDYCILALDLGAKCEDAGFSQAVERGLE